MIVEPDFLDHWKTRTLVALLGDDELAPLYIMRIWAHCQNRRQSRFDSFPAAALKGVCRFAGDADLLERSLSDVGFIGRNEDGSLSVVGWDEHNSTLVANWVNGKRGGRPRSDQKPAEKKPIDNPNANWVNPTETQTGNGVTEKRREEKIGEEELPKGNSSADAETPSSKKFKKPTVEEVAAYCAERRNSVSPSGFVDHYEANGWRVGKNPMKDWQAAVRTWEKNAFDARPPATYENAPIPKKVPKVDWRNAGAAQ